MPSNQAARSSIVILLNIGSPSAISNMSLFDTFIAMTTPISLFVINTINGMFGRRALTHIGIKTDKRRSPARTNRNSPVAVLLIREATRFMTSLNHSLPSRIFQRVRHSVFGARLAAPHPQTSATSSRANSQFDSRYLRDVATRAFTKPNRVLLETTEIALDRQTPKGLSVDVLKIVGSWFGLIGDIIGINHFSLLNRLNVVRADERLHFFRRPVSILAQAGGLS